jgi:hypothetical protein
MGLWYNRSKESQAKYYYFSKNSNILLVTTLGFDSGLLACFIYPIILSYKA